MRDTFLLNFSDGVIETGNKQVVCYKVWLWHNCWFQNVMTIVEYRQNQILIWFLLNSLHYAISPATGNKISVENEGSVEMQSGAELSFSTFSNRPKVVLIIQYFTDDRKKHNIVFFFFFYFPFQIYLVSPFLFATAFNWNNSSLWTALWLWLYSLVSFTAFLFQCAWFDLCFLMFLFVLKCYF